MGFLKSYEVLLRNVRETSDFYDAEMIIVMWETKPEIVAKQLPPPLKPHKRPMALAFFAHYSKTNFDVTPSCPTVDT